MQIIKKHDFGSTDFFWELRRFDNFDPIFHVAKANPSEPVPVWLFFSAAVTHRNVIAQAIDFSMHLALRGPLADKNGFTLDPFCALPTFIPGAVYANNILNATQHYGHASIVGYTTVTETGWYRAEVWGKSRSDAATTGQNGLAELTQEPNVLNQLLVRVED